MTLKYPSQILKPDWIETIRGSAIKAEKDKRLTKKQLELIHSQGWFQLLIPAAYGGKQKPLPELLELLEALSWADASMGWSIGLCATAGWHTTYMDNTIATDVVKNEKSTISSCCDASGTAEIVAGGYAVNGKWLQASASADSTTIIGNCVVTKKGIPVLDMRQKETIVSIPFYKNEVTFLANWKSMGIVATASDGFEVKNLLVPAQRTFSITSEQKVKGKLYQFPYYQLSEAVLGAIISGITLHFVEQCEDNDIIKNTQDGVFLTSVRYAQDGDLGRLIRKFEVARQKLFYSAYILWDSCVESKPMYPSIVHKVSAATEALCQVSRELVNELYPYCGLIVTQYENDLNRVWRDFQTASQHNAIAVSNL